jgi:hypothetical protein
MQVPQGDAAAVNAAVDDILSAPIPADPRERTDVQIEIMSARARWQKGTKHRPTADAVEDTSSKEEAVDVKMEIEEPATYGGAASSSGVHAPPAPEEEPEDDAPPPPAEESVSLSEELLQGLGLSAVEAGPPTKHTVASANPFFHTVVETTEGKARMVGGLAEGESLDDSPVASRVAAERALLARLQTELEEGIASSGAKLMPIREMQADLRAKAVVAGFGEETFSPTEEPTADYGVEEGAAADAAVTLEEKKERALQRVTEGTGWDRYSPEQLRKEMDRIGWTCR